VFDAFVEERLLALEARSQGLLEADAPVEAEREAVERLVAQAVSEEVQVTDADVERYYADHPEAFEAPEQVTLRQILVGTENEARDMVRRLQKDPKSFESLARAHSRGPEASAGGLLGVFSPGELPTELERPAFNTREGRISEIVRSPWGYHVLKVEARAAAHSRSLDESRAQIRAELVREKTDAAARAFVQRLAARAKVNHEAAEAVPGGS
jgi:parvulin-like peptidyl-prolyl isomerase